ncbi:CNNM domain-containing protein [Microscilla marina]|uniref:Mg2+ and Co2+ transporter n=1 Tax=Microscilla marina ATCC 23134 TaxID=313606 RepID=A1ZJD2_MICM2|nr:hemolysin family protein [Microscilla marina]EAY29668.1 Mg2+ and Co2+ transporter [Microscilla marina ATCC 23134]
MLLLIFYLCLAILVSFLCSVLEAVLLSITPSYAASLAQKGSRLGVKVKELKQNVDKPLSAILSLNTIAHTIGAAGVGAQASLVFGAEYLGYVSGVLTLLILILSEIIPKSIGAAYWKQLTPFTVNVLNVITKVLYPLVLISQVITKWLASSKEEASITRGELAVMTDIGEKEGVFQEGESRVIKNMLRFNSILVKDVMTPRTVVLAADENLTVQELFDDKKFLRVSRIPIYQQNIDQVVGFIHKHDLLDKMASDERNVPLSAIKRKIMIIPEETRIPALFEQFLKKREHIALSVDQYGGMSGIVTMEDVLETLLGLEIVDEFDSTQDMQALAREQWKARASKLGFPPDVK